MGGAGLTVELGSLQHLDIVDVHLLQWMDLPAFLPNLFADVVTDKFLNELFYIALLHLLLDLLDHLGSDQLPLLPGGVGGLPDLLGLAESVADAEYSDAEAIDCFAVNEGLDEGAPLPDGVESLVPVEMEAVELGVAPVALDLLDAEIELLPLGGLGSGRLGSGTRTGQICLTDQQGRRRQLCS